MECSKELSTPKVIAFCGAEAGVSAVEFALRVYLLVFYTDIVGLNAKFAGLAITLAVLIDTILDPLLGAFSDRLKSRWGTRRPIVLLGGIALGLSVSALFSCPPCSNQMTPFFISLLPTARLTFQ